MSRVGTCRNIVFAATLGLFVAWQQDTVRADYYECYPNYTVVYYGSEIQCSYPSDMYLCEGFCDLCFSNGYGTSYPTGNYLCDGGEVIACSCSHVQ